MLAVPLHTEDMHRRIKKSTQSWISSRTCCTRCTCSPRWPKTSRGLHHHVRVRSELHRFSKVYLRGLVLLHFRPACALRCCDSPAADTVRGCSSPHSGKAVPCDGNPPRNLLAITKVSWFIGTCRDAVGTRSRNTIRCANCELGASPMYIRWTNFKCPFCGTTWSSRIVSLRARIRSAEPVARAIGSSRRMTSNGHTWRKSRRLAIS